ncbi:glycoside hydrolase family 79 protein [Piloderma croceum F 1598]|uniref:Glycoside hydrolase family 79 protein n=1 Tax=Piloderma croceum (strain F 1598) TaxID=765440 RepID=A0A0C3FHZ4_PILCF|nr:glycoside hydrolase family 79 protein [Piloderma croceum F 1598]
MMANISNFVNVKWYFGIPFHHRQNFNLKVAEVVQRILGDNLISLQTELEQPVDAQEMVFKFLIYKLGQIIVEPYLDFTQYAQTMLKPLLMFKTNIVSCGGFTHVRDSFGVALWGVDYALQMVYTVHFYALFYDYFSTGPSLIITRSSVDQPVFFLPMDSWANSLVVAEIISSSNKSQIMDLNANNVNEFTPAYVVYEDSTPTRVALFNFVTDPLGASNYTAIISVEDPAQEQVKVKYLLAERVSSKDKCRWVNQTFGGHFASDSRLMGQ